MDRRSADHASLGYPAWRHFEYHPAVTSYDPSALLPWLGSTARVLEVGCGTGAGCAFLARHGHRVIGFDINIGAVSRARTASADIQPRPLFFAADALDVLPTTTSFDAVMLVRTLTCFPLLEQWRQVLDLVQRSIAPGGLLYIHDFVFDASQPAYQERYADAAALHWRPGNFVVPDEHGEVAFIAHHHTTAELIELSQPYETLLSRTHSGLSMHGNSCTMFEFIGRLQTSGS